MPSIRTLLLLGTGFILAESLGGCGSQVAENSSVTPLASTSDGSGSGQSTPSSGEGDTHDFGYVAPHAELMHEFVLRNDSSEPWALISAKTGCGCTTADPGRMSADPGEVLRIPVRVKSGERKGAHTQRVKLSFADGVPDRVLSVSYAVRAPLSITPAVSHVTLLPGQRQDLSLIIENYSESGWDEVEVRPSAESHRWISASGVREVAVKESGISFPLQRWTSAIAIDSESRASGNYVEHIDVIARSGSKKLNEQAIVNLLISPPVRVIPQNLLIVAPVPGKVTSKSLVFRFADKARVPAPESIRITHELPLDVSLTCSASEGAIITGHLDFTPRSDLPETLRGTATIEFGEPLNESVQITIGMLGRRGSSADSSTSLEQSP